MCFLKCFRCEIGKYPIIDVYSIGFYTTYFLLQQTDYGFGIQKRFTNTQGCVQALLGVLRTPLSESLLQRNLQFVCFLRFGGRQPLRDFKNFVFCVSQ